jgi:hypothetical protein
LTDVAQQVKCYRLLLVQFQHSANFVDDLKLSLDSEFLLESEVEIDETTEHFVHEIEVVGEGKFKFTEKFN